MIVLIAKGLGILSGIIVVTYTIHRERKEGTSDLYTFIVAGMVSSLIILISLKINNDNFISAMGAIGTVLMVGYIALQTRATYEMVKQTNESIMEMRKQRLNIEEFKNSLITYLRYVIGALTSNSTSGSYKQIDDPYLFVLRGYQKRIEANLSPSEVGLMWRISVFIKKFLEIYGFSLQEFNDYNKLISKFNDSKTPTHEKPELARKIQGKSQELLKIAEDIFQKVEKMGDQKLEEEILRILESP